MWSAPTRACEPLRAILSLDRSRAKPDFFHPNVKHIYTVWIVTCTLYSALRAIHCTENTNSVNKWPLKGSRGLMDRALDLKPEVTQGCGYKSRLWQEESTTEVRPLGKAPNPQLFPRRRNVGCPLLQVCVLLDGLNAENTFHSSLYSA